MSHSDPLIAIALHYGFGEEAPMVTAKGKGHIAEKILETAEAHDIAIEQNPLLAEALSKVEIDETIPLPLYQAVAEVIGFVMRTGRLQRPV
jgi:flagellar biosynthesis protein